MESLIQEKCRSDNRFVQGHAPLALCPARIDIEECLVVRFGCQPTASGHPSLQESLLFLSSYRPCPKFLAS